MLDTPQVYQQVLGRGSYASILLDAKGQASKRIKQTIESPDVLMEAYLMARLPRRASLLSATSIQCYKTCTRIQMECAPHGSLNQCMTRVSQLSLQQLIGIAHQLGDAVYALHANGLMHLDIKPDNIMVFSWPHDSNKKQKRKARSPPEIRLGDLGFVHLNHCPFPRSPNHLVTQIFRSPELLSYDCDQTWGLSCWKGPTFAADVFSFGLVLAQLLSVWYKKRFDVLPLFYRENMQPSEQVKLYFQNFAFPISSEDWIMVMPPTINEPKGPKGPKGRNHNSLTQWLRDLFPGDFKRTLTFSQDQTMQHLISLANKCMAFQPDERPTSCQIMQQLTFLLPSNIPAQLPIAIVPELTMLSQAAPRRANYKWIRNKHIRQQLRLCHRVWCWMSHQLAQEYPTHYRQRTRNMLRNLPVALQAALVPEHLLLALSLVLSSFVWPGENHDLNLSHDVRMVAQKISPGFRESLQQLLHSNYRW